MEEFMEHEEEFEARQSISSRGRDTRVKMMPEQERQLPAQVRNEVPAQVRGQPREEPSRHLEYAEGEGEESSVITEIVDEQIVELKSDDEENIDDGINRYLDNIKKEDYVNREEYQEFYDNKEEGSPYKQEDEYREGQDVYQHNANYQHEDEQNMQQLAYQNKMMEHSPIVENPIEEELTASPQYYEAPRAVNPKYRRKYEGANLNDKSHLIWERERLQRKRIEKQMMSANIWTKPYSYRDLDWNPALNPKKAAFDYNKSPQRSPMWHFAQSSSVPMLSAGGPKGAPSKPLRAKHDPKETAAKRDHTINNIFLQSSLQSALTGSGLNSTAPMSHSSLSMSKNNQRPFMTAIDNRYQNQTNVLEGRARMFHSSQIF